MTNKKMSSTIFGLISVIFAYFIFSIITVSVAATATISTKGERALQDMINAESARVAELNVQLDPAQGIIHTLQKKSSGNDVKLLQQFLKIYGVYPDGLITGYFGSLTEAAVKKFQQREGISTVGVAGPKTRIRIKEISQEQVTAVATVTTSTETSFSPTITDAVLASSIADNGSATSATSTFASTTQNMYAVLSLKNVSQDAQVAYVRYFQGNYVDSEISHPSRGGLAYFHFQWSLKPGVSRTPGNYSLVFYLDGKNMKTIKYSIY